MASLFRIPPPMDETTRVRCDAMMKQVENACSDMLLSPDWTLNMQIVDELNRERDPVVLIEVIRILRKRLGSTNTRVLSVGLTLAETLVKNCHDPVHKEMASERFMTAVAKIARTYSFKTNRESIAIADQALDIVQAWGEAFLPRRREFPLFVETYHELRAEGLPFSEQYQSDRPPVLDPGAGSLLDRPSAAGSGQGSARPAAAARSAAAAQGPQAGGGQGAGGATNSAESSDPNDLRELSVSDREIVATGASCSEMLEQVLQAAESRAEVRDSEITAEVVEQLNQVGPKISGIIEANGEGDAGMLEALFKVNDAVDSVLRLHKDVVDGVKSVPLLPPSSYSSNIGAVSARMEGLSIEQVAGARAAASKLRKNIPTLSRPPSDRKHRRGKSSESTDKAKAGGSADTVDLLSGFELDGASNSNANKSVAVTPVQGDAAASVAPGGADIFAGFAVPAPPPAATSAASAAAVAGAGGDWVVVGRAPGGEAQAQENPPTAVAAGQYGQQQALTYNPQPTPGSTAGPPSTADKAQSLMANLGALYAGGATSTTPAMSTAATGGSVNIGGGVVGSAGVGAGTVPSSAPPTISGYPEVGGSVAAPSTAWGAGAAPGGSVQGWAGSATGGNNSAMQASGPLHVSDPFADPQQQQQLSLPPHQQGQQSLFPQGQQAPYQQGQQPQYPQQHYQPQPVYEQQQGQQQAQYHQQMYPNSVPPQPQNQQQAQQQAPQAQQPFP
ncbi:unnamed protein product [Scytosiphon promiscuus]